MGMKPINKAEIVYPTYNEIEEKVDFSPEIPQKVELVYKAYAEQVRDSSNRKPIPPDIMLDLNPNLPFDHGLGFGIGFRRKTVSLVASRPGAGKTAFLLNAINNIITSGKFNIAVFLPDMPTAEFCEMLTAVRAGVDYNCFRRGGIRRDKMGAVKKAGKEISGANLWISTEKTFSLESVVKSAQKLNSNLKREKKKLDAIFIDSYNYLEGCGDPFGHKGWDFERLTDLAKATDSAVICAYGLEPEKADVSAQTHFKLRDFRIRGISEDAVGLIINIVHPDHSEPPLISRDEMYLDIVWDKFAPYGHGFMVLFNRSALRFYPKDSCNNVTHSR
ncbi:MAG: hypothetical protein NTX59_02575 [Elusimicrobia bacterium]|nr:hypothetical protein [Elusimicrobiota bacterium]